MSTGSRSSMMNYGPTSTYNNSGYGRRNNYRKRAGPYKQLTTADRHTNPVYPKPELKSVDSMANGGAYDPGNFNFYPIPAAGTVVCLNEIGQGTALGQYIGTQVSIKSLSIRYSIILNQDTPAPTSGRVIFLWDKQPQGSPPGTIDILTTANYLSYLNMDNRDRFVVLCDKQYAMDQSGGHESVQFKVYKKISLPTIFNAGTAGTVADITSGSLYLLTISENAKGVVPDEYPVVTGSSRIRYDDS